MDKLKAFEKPIGFRDLLSNVTAKKRLIENSLQELFSKWGYQEVITPTLEYDETVGKASKIPDFKMFKLVDRLGKTLVLRPDMTAPIARVVSSIIRNQVKPTRLSYHSNVFRSQENEAGKVAEFYQSGIELIGEGTPDADAEVLALAAESLELLHIGSFRLAVGHTGFLNGLLDDWVKDERSKDTLKAFLSEKNIVGYREKVREIVSSKEGITRLMAILEFQGDDKKLVEALQHTESPMARQAINELLQVWKLLKIYGVESNVTFDLTLVPHLEYYTGMVFEGTAEHTGFPICSGGRYDSLLEAFNNSQQAVGFALKINRILEISNIKQGFEKGIKVIYDAEHQEEALSYVTKMRKQSKAVETYRIDGKDIPNIKTDDETVWLVGEEHNNR